MDVSAAGRTMATLCLLALLTGCAPSTTATGNSTPAETFEPVQRGTPSHHDVMPIDEDDAPCRGGKRTTLDAVAEDLDFALFVPSHALANDSSVREVWRCPTSVNERRVIHDDGSTETPDSFKSVGALLRFDSGVWVVQERSLDAAHADWAGQVASGGGSVGTVHGQPAWLLPPREPDGDGAVSFVEDDVMVRLIGNGVLSIETLHEIAESMHT